MEAESRFAIGEGGGDEIFGLGIGGDGEVALDLGGEGNSVVGDLGEPSFAKAMEGKGAQGEVVERSDLFRCQEVRPLDGEEVFDIFINIRLVD